LTGFEPVSPVPKTDILPLNYKVKNLISSGRTRTYTICFQKTMLYLSATLKTIGFYKTNIKKVEYRTRTYNFDFEDQCFNQLKLTQPLIR
jgi:hypothetical protein